MIRELINDFFQTYLYDFCSFTMSSAAIMDRYDNQRHGQRIQHIHKRDLWRRPYA